MSTAQRDHEGMDAHAGQYGTHPTHGWCVTCLAIRPIHVLEKMPDTCHKERVQAESRRGFWWGLLAAIISAGLLSRMTHTGFLLLDKYLGDALYAAMVYVLFRLSGRVAHVTVWAAVTMAAIEFFQLTRIPAGMLRSEYLAVRICARLLGTEFSVLDLLAYAAGIGCLAAIDRLGLALGGRPRQRS